MDQHDDNSGEQTDSGISSTFTNDMEHIFADTVNSVMNDLCFLNYKENRCLFFVVSC